MSALSAQAIRIGAASRDITPDISKPTYIAGFGMNRLATTVHDPLMARCIAIKETASKPLVICGVDSIGLFLEDVDKIRQQVTDADVVVSAAHQHSAPDTLGIWGPTQGTSGIDEAYNQKVIEETVAAAKEALSTTKLGNLRFAKIDGKNVDAFVNDSRPPYVKDIDIVAVRAADLKGNTIATLINWNNHPEVLPSSSTAITSDFVGPLCNRVEKTLGGKAIFINGAVGGLMTPIGTKVFDSKASQDAEGFRKAELIGERVADLAVQALKKPINLPVPITKITFKEARIEIPLDNPGFKMAADAGVFKGRKQPVAKSVGHAFTTTVGYIRFSAPLIPVLEIALIPGELYPELSVGGVERLAGADFDQAPTEPIIKKELMRARFRMVFGLANDEIGYIIPKVEWDNKEPWLRDAPKRWYGEINSVGPEAAPLIIRTLKQLIDESRDL
jgi:hypothetical protein